MRYLTWNLIWPNEGEYGLGPEPIAANNGARLEASEWVTPNVEHGTILGYLHGDFDLTLVQPFNATELTENQALEFAQSINPEAFVADDGTIQAPSEML